MKSRTWLDSLVRHVAERGRELLRKDSAAQDASSRIPRDPVRELVGICEDLLSQKGEACGTALAKEALDRLKILVEEDRYRFFHQISEQFAPNQVEVASRYQAWIAQPTADRRNALTSALEGRRQQLFRRMNMAPGGTKALVDLRAQLLECETRNSTLAELESDLKHLLSSWFNRGFLEFQKISWETPADILEKLIAYEAVHEVAGWEDMRRRLAPDRRCYAFFHPALSREPLIFVEVALQKGISTAVAPIFDSQVTPAVDADTAIFYSISNCQKGLRGINFGNFLIKQVVDELRSENSKLECFSTLSPVPGLRRWCTEIEAKCFEAALGDELTVLLKFADTEDVLLAREFLIEAADEETPDPRIGDLLLRLCANYLCELPGGPSDPVARFHLGNGARLERINVGADYSAKGRVQSFGLMVNYLYLPDQIVANHEAYSSRAYVARSDAVASITNSNRSYPVVTLRTIER
jgi:malonyl-CoA decarboxylase